MLRRKKKQKLIKLRTENQWEKSMKPRAHSLKRSIKINKLLARLREKKRSSKLPISGMKEERLLYNVQTLKG